MKRKIFQLVSHSQKSGDASWFFNGFIIIMIILNVAAIILESFDTILVNNRHIFTWFEYFSVVVFSIEYLLRLWSITEDARYHSPVKGRIKFAFTPLAIIDLLAVLPFYLPLLGFDLRHLRLLRMFRLFRIFKLARYIRALDLVNRVVHKKREELIIALVFILFLLLISSTMMYYVENEAQPEAFSNIPETMWWGIATLTTVGYGDVIPITPYGKLLGGVIALLGVGIFALPAGILASGFSDELSIRRKGGVCCPQCGTIVKTDHHDDHH
jgi:voltage-gated potassium channel